MPKYLVNLPFSSQQDFQRWYTITLQIHQSYGAEPFLLSNTLPWHVSKSGVNTLGKIVPLKNVQHVTAIKKNLVSGSLLSRDGYKLCPMVLFGCFDHNLGEMLEWYFSMFILLWNSKKNKAARRLLFFHVLETFLFFISGLDIWSFPTLELRKQGNKIGGGNCGMVLVFNATAKWWYNCCVSACSVYCFTTTLNHCTKVK